MHISRCFLNFMLFILFKFPRSYSSLLYTILRSLSSSNQIKKLNLSKIIPENTIKNMEKSPENIMNVEYKFDGNIRHVVPYVHVYKTYVKGRWLSRKLIDVLTKEFGGHPKNYWVAAISLGNVNINDKTVDENYIIKNGDILIHRAHRHEPPVKGCIKLVGETDDILAINKPASIPMHPCGAYRYNSVMYIIAKEPMIINQPKLSLVHRLDRVTSGLVILAKSKESANSICLDIRKNRTKKVYLAKVKGRFPAKISFLNKLSHTEIYHDIKPDLEIDDLETDELNSSEDNLESERGRKRMKTGTGTTVTSNKEDSQAIQNRIVAAGALIRSAKEANDSSLLIEAKQAMEAALEERKLHTISKRSVTRIQNDNNSNSYTAITESASDYIVTQTDHNLIASDSSVGYFRTDNDFLMLKCPVGTLSYRDGAHACALDGKKSLSGFKMLEYDPVSDTSLVECHPVTGRTHQLRVHLQFLGNPIANDPCYGGELFYNDVKRRSNAITLLKALKRLDYQPLSKIPHISMEENDAGVDKDAIDLEMKEIDKIVAEYSDVKTGSKSIGETPDSMSKIDQLKQNCRYCQEYQLTSTLEQMLHCDGIWLHALKYQGADWSFTTEPPDWALDTFPAVNYDIIGK